MEILFLVYLVAGYWAAGVLFYENKIIIHSWGALFFRKVMLGLIFGFILIPVAILKRMIFK